MRSGRPEVSSPPTGNQPRQAPPAVRHRDPAFSASSSAKNLATTASTRSRHCGSTPWPTIVKKPMSRHARSRAAATASPSPPPFLAPSTSGATSTTCTAGPTVTDVTLTAATCLHGGVAKNVLGGELEPCSVDPLTGFYRDGCCETGSEDVGVHVVCARMTDEFHAFSREQGNDLSTPRPGFSGLVAGDRWCLCASRWHEAFEAGVAPPVVLEATHALAVEWCSIAALRAHAV